MSAKVIYPPFGKAHEMYAYYQAGLTFDVIAKMFGTTPFVVSQEVNRYVKRLNEKLSLAR